MNGVIQNFRQRTGLALAIGLWSIVATSLFAAPLEVWNQPGNRANSTETPHRPPVLFILDASGSMAENFGGVSRMAAARLMLDEQLARLEKDVPVGLVAYGNRIPGCGSVRIYAPIRTDNRTSVKSQVQQMQPAGSTPIARTLRLVGESLIPANPGTTVVLISDGAESCGGNPSVEARQLLAQGKDIQINVIGLSVDEATAVELGDIARAGKGEYFHVQNHTDLDRAIRSSLMRVVNDPKPLVADAPEALANDSIESRWSTGDAPPPADTSNRPPFEITGVRYLGPVADDPQSIEFEIDYRFYHQRPGNFLVRMHAVQRAAVPGPGGGRVPGGDALLAIANNAHYAVDRATGQIRLRVPGAYVGPLNFQGELWETSNVPEALHLSNPVAARRTP